MILFAQDWLDYPEAIPDTKTPNKSYLRLAKMLQMMGVKNCLFHLSLLQPQLQGVDTRDPNLTVDQVVMIKTEARKNFWYMMREVIRIPAASGDGEVFFDINRGALAAWWCYLSHQDYNLTQPRQTGKSTSTNVLLVWLLFVVYRNTRVFLLTKDDKLRTENVEQIKKIQDLLPSYMNPKTKEDLSNTQTVTCAKYKNRLLTAVPQNSEADANKTGRGFTCATYVTDEGPFIKFLEKSLRSMLAGGIKAMRVAEANGLPFGAIYTTTAGSKAEEDGKYYYRMITGGVVWDESFLDIKDGEALRRMVRTNKTGVQSIINITMSHLQLGYTDAWLKDTIERIGVTGDDANKDLFNVWSDGSFSSPLPKILTNMIRNSEVKPMHIEFTKDDYALNWYIPKESIDSRMASGKYIIGLDTSEVVGKDGIGFFMIDSQSLETICTLGVTETNILKFIDWLVAFMLKYENTILIPERRSTGSTVIAALLIAFVAKKIDPFKRIYNTVIDEGKHHTPEGRKLISDIRHNPQAADRAIKLFGFATSGGGEHSRSGLYLTILSRAASYSGPILKDKKTIDEVLSLTKKNNRIDHSVLGHDDRVIAWLLTIWFLTSSRNLDYYGVERALEDAIDHNTRLRYMEGREDGSSDNIVPHEAFQKAQEQKRLRKQMDEYLERIKSTSDELLLLRYEATLRRLDSKLIKEENEFLSISDMIKNAKEEKRNRGKEKRRAG